MGAGSNTVRKKSTENGRFFLITADQIRVYLIEQFFYSFLTKDAGSDTDRIQYYGMPENIGFFSGMDTGFDFCIVRNSGVQESSLTKARDLCRFFVILPHNGTSASGQKKIGNILHSHRIGETVDFGRFPADILKNYFYISNVRHRLSPDCMKYLAFFKNAKQYKSEDTSCEG